MKLLRDVFKKPYLEIEDNYVYCNLYMKVGITLYSWSESFNVVHRAWWETK